MRVNMSMKNVPPITARFNGPEADPEGSKEILMSLVRYNVEATMIPTTEALIPFKAR